MAFQEVGLQPGAASTIEVGVERTTSLRCTVPGAPDQVVLDTSSSASATETSTLVADGHGRLRGERLLHAAPGTVQLEGLECTTTERITVSLRDLTSGAALTVEQ